MGYFGIVVVGFETLGISPGNTFLLLFLILIGSLINIPLTKKKLVVVQEKRFFGLFSVPRIRAHYLAINLGGAVIPSLLSLYFLFLVQKQGLGLSSVFIAIFLMTLVSYRLSRIVPGKGIVLPSLIPPIFSALLALILAPQFTAPCAFIAGTLGTLIGADLLNLKRIRNYQGFLSVGGAGVFDGIFLVGVISTLLSG